VDVVGQFQEFGKHQLGDVINPLVTVPLEDVAISLAGIARPARTHAIIRGVEQSGDPRASQVPVLIGTPGSFLAWLRQRLPESG
jgi:hypothetical protein